MAGTKNTRDTSDALSDNELRSFQAKLATLAQTASDYPLEYALGAYELLFESRDDIQSIVENLGESIAELQNAA
jgi:uncharacterized protein YlxW (UPF0749 family)